MVLYRSGNSSPVVQLTSTRDPVGRVIVGAQSFDDRQSEAPLPQVAGLPVSGQPSDETACCIFPDEPCEPGPSDTGPLSNMAFLMLLRRVERDDITPHGMRSSFRDWASECTNFPNEVSEMALAHVVENATEAAYRRGDLFEKRRKLMEAWASYCEPRKSAKVLLLKRRP